MLRRRATIFFQSGMFDSRDFVDGGHEILPALALRLEDFSTFSGEAVIAAAALFGLFDPASGEPAAVFEAREQRVESGHVEAKGTGRTELDETGDIVPVAGFLFEKGEDEELGAAFLPFLIGGRGHICESIILEFRR